LGSQNIQEVYERDAAAGESVAYEHMKAAVMAAVQNHFRPEFINRLDDIVVFHPLGQEQIQRIAAIQTRYLAARLADRQIGLRLSESALALLGNIGFDPVYGARPLKRAIQAQLENPLANRILSGEFGAGDTVQVDTDGVVLTFSKT
ncbi:MAG: type VI secretion system ATPase TssH, partial [Arenimonas sp.]